MKKFLFFVILISKFALAQNSNFINLNLQKNEQLIYSIARIEDLISPKGKYYHTPSHTNQEIELTFLYNEVNDKVYSWKIIDFEHKHESCKKCEKYLKNDYRKNITVVFKIDSLGRYKTIKNLSQVKQNILRNIAEQEKYSNKKQKQSIVRIKKLPEIVISAIEEDIIIFFRYYGLETNTSETTIHSRRANFPFSFRSPPFKTDINVSNNEQVVKVNLENTFDRLVAKDDDYNMIRFNQNIEKLKYNLTAQEEYVFSKENFRILSAKISATEISNFHDDGIFNYQYVITQKE